MRVFVLTLSVGMLAVACAASGAGDELPAGADAPAGGSERVPEGTGFEPASADAAVPPSTPAPKDAGGSTSSTSSSSGSTSSTSSSSGSTSSTSSTSGGPGTGACGVCDRVWTCNGFADDWQTQGARCVNTRTTTALRCDHEFDQGTSYGVGTWSATTTTLTLVYPMLGGGTKSYDCD